jgi:hypothetical protein
MCRRGRCVVMGGLRTLRVAVGWRDFFGGISGDVNFGAGKLFAIAHSSSFLPLLLAADARNIAPCASALSTLRSIFELNHAAVMWKFEVMTSLMQDRLYNQHCYMTYNTLYAIALL